MTSKPVVVVHQTKDELIDAVAARFIRTLTDVLDKSDAAHVCLTGGSVGIGVLAAIPDEPQPGIDWTRVHFWWGDERWLPEGDSERNAQQARDALLDRLSIPAANVHPFPASDQGLDLDAAATLYADTLKQHAATGRAVPTFDITFLGVGPDGHVASLFPNHDQVDATGTVVAVRDSPKPPPERLSLTLPVLNGSERVWLAVAGSDKASALGLGLAGASRRLLPVAGVQAKETVFFVDTEAAADIPAARSEFL